VTQLVMRSLGSITIKHISACGIDQNLQDIPEITPLSSGHPQENTFKSVRCVTTSSVFLDKSTGHQPVKKFPAVYESRRFITEYKTDRHLSLLSVTLHTYSPMKMEYTGCSETLAFKQQTPGNHPEESIRQINLIHDIPANSFNPLTPELNLSARRCLMRYFTGDFAS
jgi:hypothetical protein